MSDRKFTAPEEFPAEYVDSEGGKAVILGRGPHKELPFIGHGADGYAACWTEEGEYPTDDTSGYDLHDTPKRITTWHNVYVSDISVAHSSREDADDPPKPTRTCVYRIERDEDGGNPEIFVEEV